MVGMTTRLRRTRNRILGIKPPTLSNSQMRELGRSVAEAFARGIEQGRTAPRPPIDPNWKPPMQLTRDQYLALIGALEDLGWEEDWGDLHGGMGVEWPNMGGGGWISWREESGKVIYSLSDDCDTVKDRVDFDTGGSDDPKVIALAADHALHMAWHEYEAARHREQEVKLRQLGGQLARVRALTHRLIVTPAMIRGALADPEPPK